MTKQDKTVLITGASAGIGLEFARLYLERGCSLILTGRNEEKLARVRDGLAGPGRVAACLVEDLEQPGGGEALHRQCREAGLEVDILVNNAGFGLWGRQIDLPLPGVRGMVDLNVTALTELATLFGRDMAARGDGAILNVASSAAFQPVPYMAVYGATKAYVLSFSEALAEELAGSGVTVTCLCPGPTSSDFFDRAKMSGSMTGMFATRRLMSPRQVAEIGVTALDKGCRVAIPGLLNNILVFMTRLSPRKLVVKAAKSVTPRPE